MSMRRALSLTTSSGSVAGFRAKIVDAVDDPLDDGSANPQQTVERHAEFRRQNLTRIGWRHGCDAIGELQAAFEIADAFEVLDPVDRHRARRQADRSERGGREVTLERQIVDGEDRFRLRTAVVMQINRRQRRLPVVGVDYVRRVTWDSALGEVGADPSQSGETLCVVAPVAPVRAEIGVADAVEEMRRVEHK